MGIEPTYAAWKAAVLPLNYVRRAGLGRTPLDSCFRWLCEGRAGDAPVAGG